MPIINSFLYYCLSSVRSFLYYGENKFCPFCKKSFRKFLPFGINSKTIKKYKVIGAGKRDVKCPFCGSTDRERLLYLFLLKRTNLFNYKKKFKLLHVGPEKNIGKIIKAHPEIQYYSIDINPNNADIKMDITDIKFKNDFFDAIICCHVLEHIKDDTKAISELYRVLKQGGWAILQVPISPFLKRTIKEKTINTPSERERLFGQRDHVRIYGQDYIKRLNKVGFKVKKDRFASKIEKTILDRESLNKDETIFYCQK